MYKIIILTIAIIFLGSCASEPKEASETISNKDFCSSIHRDSTVSLGRKLDSLSDLMTHKTGVYVLEDGDGVFRADARCGLIHHQQLRFLEECLRQQ